ncbi:MAG: class I SAM-dependent methyltransferase [Candidatus Methanoperedens sp.]
MKILSLHGSQYSNSSGNSEIQEHDWVVLHPDQSTSVSYDVSLDIIGVYRLQIKTLAGSEETIKFGGSVYLDNIFVGDIAVHSSNGTNNVLESEFKLNIKTGGNHTIKIYNEISRLHLRIMGLSIDFDVGIKSVLDNRELFVLQEISGRKDIGVIPNANKTFSLEGLQYSDRSGNVEIKDQNWLLLYPDQNTSVSYDVNFDMIGEYGLQIKTLAGSEENIPFGGTIYLDNDPVGDIGVHWSNGITSIFTSEFILNLKTTGKHTIKISNEVRKKNTGKVLCSMHLRIMGLSTDFYVGIKSILDNREIIVLQEISGLKDIGVIANARKTFSLEGLQYSDRYGNVEIQEQNWLLLPPDQNTSVSYDVNFDMIGEYGLQIKTLAGSEEKIPFGGTIYLDNNPVGDIGVHWSNGITSIFTSEFILNLKTTGKHTIKISNEVREKNTGKVLFCLHLRILGLSTDFDVGIKSVLDNRELFVLHEISGLKDIGVIPNAKKTFSLEGSQYSDSSGNIEIQEQNWLILHPDQNTSVSYDVNFDLRGACRLQIKTHAGSEEKMPFGGTLYLDNNPVGDIGVHWSNGINSIFITEFILNLKTTGKHTIKISNEVREKNTGKELCRMHLRILEIFIIFDKGIKSVIDNPEMYGVTGDFVETLENYLSGLKDIGDGRLYEHSFMAQIGVDHFKIYVDYINKFKSISCSTILELGCGSGGSLPQLESHGARVIGIEIDPSLVKLTHSRLKTLNNAHCVQGDGFYLPFSDGTFDICIFSHVLEHVPDPHKMVEEIHRVLKVGGIALIEFPNRLYPIELHGNLVLIPYLPLKIARLYATILRRMWFISDDYKSRLYVLHLLQGEYSYFSVNKILNNLSFTICDINPIDRLILEIPKLKKYPYILKRLLSLLISRNITIIVRKEGN